MPLYDAIGSSYAKSRLPDPRISARLRELLGLPTSALILDVGAGTGKYSIVLAEAGYNLMAIEPSEVMRKQITPHPRVSVLAAAAENIPMDDDSADGAFVVLAIHHFVDRGTALREILRVIGRGPLVIFAFEPSLLSKFWLADYFPRLGRETGSSYSALIDVGEEVRKLTDRVVRTEPFPLPRDLVDRFAAAGWATPEIYLDQEIRGNISSFALMQKDEVDYGVSQLAKDLASGEWDRRNGALRRQSYLDVGYRFIIATQA